MIYVIEIELYQLNETQSQPHEKNQNTTMEAQTILGQIEGTHSANEDVRISLFRSKSYKKAVDRDNNDKLDSFLSPHGLKREGSSRVAGSILSIIASDTLLNSENKRSKKRVDFI